MESKGGIIMQKNDGFAKWKSRLDFFKTDMGFGPLKQYRNEDGNLHRDNGPAWISPTRTIWYQNGRKHGPDADIHGSIHYYYENIRIPPHYYTKPETLTLEEVLGHNNAECRYVGMKALGMEKVMNHKKAKIIDRDDSKGQILFTINGIFDEPVSFVKVVNSTQEPDGSYKDYYLCVPPPTQGITTCKDAVAWTFGLTGKTYNPEQET
jgi:hypothetical protein